MSIQRDARARSPLVSAEFVSIDTNNVAATRTSKRFRPRASSVKQAYHDPAYRRGGCCHMAGAPNGERQLRDPRLHHRHLRIWQGTFLLNTFW
jgi:hypothetical protein